MDNKTNHILSNVSTCLDLIPIKNYNNNNNRSIHIGGVFFGAAFNKTTTPQTA